MGDDRPTVTGKDAALVYLADSIAAFRYEQVNTNELLREMLNEMRGGRRDVEPENEQDVEADEFAKAIMGQLTPKAPPNGSAAPK